jgi:translocator protein
MVITAAVMGLSIAPWPGMPELVMGASFFESLNKPSWIPPDWAFPVAWFTLWALQIAALVRLLALERSSGGRRVALLLLGGQFVASVIWQAVIFGPGRLLLAALWLTLVLVLVVASTVAAFRVDRFAGVLIAPTIAWVSVATALGWTLYQLNPGA